MPGGIDARKVSRSIDSLGRITRDPYRRLLAARENCERLVGHPYLGTNVRVGRKPVTMAEVEGRITDCSRRL